MTRHDETRRSRDRGDDINADLGFGSVVARESRQRLLNRDGSFNVRRTGLRFGEALSLYHYLLTISWTKFLGLVVLAYLFANALFASIYLLCGEGALSGTHALTPASRFGEEFFFSVQTLATIGYGTVAPANIAANVVVTVEALVGLLGVAVIAGLAFARLSRPVAQIVFSRNAIIGPYRGGRALMFRIVNRRSSQLVNLEAKVLLARKKRQGGRNVDRQFIALALERESVVFFPLAWTIVHPIDDDSPLRDWASEDLAECDAEFLVLLNGFDETFSQNVHARSSYKPDEVVWGARFVSMFQTAPDGTISVDIRQLHAIERADV